MNKNIYFFNFTLTILFYSGNQSPCHPPLTFVQLGLLRRCKENRLNVYQADQLSTLLLRMQYLTGAWG